MPGVDSMHQRQVFLESAAQFKYLKHGEPKVLKISLKIITGSSITFQFNLSLILLLKMLFLS